MNHKVDIADDMLLYRSGNGLQLIKPEDAGKQVETPHFYSTGSTVADIMKLDFNFYFLNREGETLYMNDQCVDICGFESAEHSVGKSLLDVSTQASANRLIENCSEVITENKIKIFEEENIRNDGISLRFLSVKSPWYDDKHHIIGIIGCSIVMGKQSLSESLAKIAHLGLLNSDGFTINHTVIPSIPVNNGFLSERESLCLFHLCKGFTLKEIAKITALSPKTVETYIARAKQKLHCQNKAELIAAFLKLSNEIKS